MAWLAGLVLLGAFLVVRSVEGAKAADDGPGRDGAVTRL
jgi:hypothetical protein